MTTRAVLVVDAIADMQQTKAAVDLIASLGYELVGVVGPHDYRQAHKMIGDDTADIIMFCRHGDLPSVALAAPDSGRRTEPLLRRPQAVPGQRTEILRRPRPVA